MYGLLPILEVWGFGFFGGVCVWFGVFCGVVWFGDVFGFFFLNQDKKLKYF